MRFSDVSGMVSYQEMTIRSSIHPAGRTGSHVRTKTLSLTLESILAIAVPAK
jgi:hypothetical protein